MLRPPPRLAGCGASCHRLLFIVDVGYGERFLPSMGHKCSASQSSSSGALYDFAGHPGEGKEQECGEGVRDAGSPAEMARAP